MICIRHCTPVSTKASPRQTSGPSLSTGAKSTPQPSPAPPDVPPMCSRWNSAESTHGEKLRQLTRSFITPPVLSIVFFLRLAKVFPRTTGLAKHIERTPRGASVSREDSHGIPFRSFSSRISTSKILRPGSLGCMIVRAILYLEPIILFLFLT
jgi:hypothetical protein